MTPNTLPHPTLDEYQQRALQTHKRRAPAAKAARKLLAVQIERSKQMGLAARQAQAATVKAAGYDSIANATGRQAR